MAEIIPFGRPPKPPDELLDPHWQGKARCLACGHEWRAVEPIGTLAAMPGPDRATLTLLKMHI